MSMLGIARKSGALLIGSKAAEEAIVSNRARLIILCADAGNSTKRNFRRLAEKCQVELVLFPSKIQLGKLIGVKEAAVVVLTEDSFAGRVKELINSGGE